MNKKMLVLLIGVFFLVGALAPMVSADTTKLQIWRNATTGANVSWVDNNGNWYMLGDLNLSGNIYADIVGTWNGSSDYYLKSNPFGFYNSTNFNISDYRTLSNLTFNGNTIVNGNFTVDGTDLFVNSNTGNVGIGTVNPTYKTTISAGGSTGSGVNTPLSIGGGMMTSVDDATELLFTQRSTDYTGAIRLITTTATPDYLNPRLGFFTQNTNTYLKSDLVERFSILAGTGNVGIGTSSPQKTLHVSGTGAQIRVEQTATAGTNLPGYQIYNENTFQGGLFYSEARDNVELWSSNSTSLPQMVIKSTTGNVGIGTTTPQNKLNVVGDGNFTGTVYGNAFVGGGAGLTGLTGSQLSNNLNWINATYGNATYLLISGENNLNVNNSDWWDGLDTPADILISQLNNNLNFINATTLVETDPKWTGNQSLYVPYTGASSNLVLGDNNLSIGGTDLFVDNNNGRVGIGTSSPRYALDVTGGASFAGGASVSSYMDGSIQVYNSLGMGSSNNLNPSINRWSLRVRPDGQEGAFDIYDARNSLSRMLIDTNGNVGIGTTSPQNKLNVIGDINATTNIYGNVLYEGGTALSSKYYGIGNPYSYLNSTTLSGAEVDPKWTSNFTAYNSSWSSTYNVTYNTWAYNQTTPAQAYADATFLRKDGDNGTGTYNFNGGWQSNGVSVIGGNLYAQSLYAYNISSLAVTHLNINGSLIPPTGYDNQFDVGSPSLRWKDGYFAGNVIINGSIIEGDISGIETDPLWTSNFTAYNSTWSSTYNASYVPYTGSNANVVLGDYNFSVGTSDFFVNSNTGNVGIGTTGPAYKLDVYGGDSSEGVIQIKGGEAQDARLRLIADQGDDLTNADHFQIIHLASNNNIEFQRFDGAGWVGKMVIDSSGNVGIGTVSPTKVLDVRVPYTKTDTSERPIFSLLSNETTASKPAGLYLAIKGGATQNDRYALLQTTETGEGNGGNFILQPYAGNVGIGTTSPTSNLEIKGASGQNTNLTINGGYGGYTGFLNLVMHGGNPGDSPGIIDFKINSSGTIYTVGRIRTQMGSDAYKGNMSFYVANDSGNLVERMKINTNGNVGIGTTTPSTKLEVNGTINASQILVNGTAVLTSLTGAVTGAGTYGYIPMWNGTSSINNSVVYQNGTNVGIGTTAPTGGKLVIENTGSSIPGLVVVSNDQATSRIELRNTIGERYQFVAGTVGVDNNGLSIYDATSAETRFYIKNNGNVGIGTTSPTSKLHVAGNMSTFGNTSLGSGALFVNNNTGYVGIGTTSPRESLVIQSDNAGNYPVSGAYLNLYVNETNQYGGIGVDAVEQSHYRWLEDGNLRYQLRQGSTTGGDLRLYSWGTTTDIMVWNYSTGNVGIGTTSPASKLHVNGSAIINGTLIGLSNATDSTGAVTLSQLQGVNNSITGNYVPYNGSTKNVALGAYNFSVDGTDLFVNSNTGNVGIGTGSPGAKLSVIATGAQSAGFFQLDSTTTTWSATQSVFEMANANATTNNHALFQFSDNTARTGSAGFGAKFTDRTNHYADVYIWTKAADGYNQRLYVQSDGKVGINTTSPQNTLNVLGDINATGLIYGNGSQLTGISVTESDPKWTGNSTLVPYLASSNTFTNNNVLRGNFTVGTNYLFVNNNTGYVGINTTTPLSVLHTHGDYVTFGSPIYGADAEVIRFARTDSPSIRYHSIYAQTTTDTSLGKLQFRLHNGTTTTSQSTVMTLLANGNVGIGTTSPSYPLEVVGTIGSFNPGADAIHYLGEGETGGSYGSIRWNSATDTLSLGTQAAGETTQLVLNEAGNVGIGTTAPDIAKLQILAAGSGITQQQAAGDHFYSLGFTGHDAYLTYYTSAGMTFGYGETTGGVPTVNTLRLLNNGNVGIGTTAPTTKLTINVSDGTAFNILRAGTQKFNISVDADWTTITSNANRLQLNDYTNTGISINAGNVGIGTITPQQKLHVNGSMLVNGTINSTVDLCIQGGACLSTAGTGAGTITGAGTAMRIPLWNGTASLNNSNIYQGASGNIGIGAASPTQTLSVNGSITVQQYSAGVAQTVYIGGSDINGAFGVANAQRAIEFDKPADNTGNIYFWTHAAGAAATRKLTILGSGNVGIGDTTPDSLLDVEGTLTVNQTNAQAGRDMVFNSSTGTGNVIFIIG